MQHISPSLLDLTRKDTSLLHFQFKYFYVDSIPEHCPRIFCTNSPWQDFFPRFPSEGDRTGVMRRKLFQIISGDLRKGSGQDLLTTSQGQSSGGGSALDDAEGFSFDEDGDF